MTDWAFASATELAAAIATGQVSSLEITDMYIRRIEKYDNRTNAVVVRDFERAREASRRADERRHRGDSGGPLDGVPMTVKESYDVEGLPTTWGIPFFKDNIATGDAEVVRRLKGAGAHILGKTNVPKNLADFQSFNPIYGTTNNPFDLSRTPGGSSGGAAAALAAGLTGLEAGSDIGGSIRNPAHYSGVYGHKPTWGIVPVDGHALPGMIAPPDIAVVGPLARSAEDLALALGIVAGADRINSAGWRLELPRPAKKNLGEFRVALWPTHPLAPVAGEISDRVQETGNRLARLGATVSDRALPKLDFEECFQTYSSLLWGVMGAGLGEEEKAANRTRRATLDPDDRSMEASMVRFSIQEHGEWLASSNRRFEIRRAWAEFFESWDILICPQMATTAYPHDHGPYFDREISVDGQRQNCFQQVFWSGMITVAHLPSTAFPTGLSKEGLPIGLQAAGPEFSDYTTIEFTRLLAREIGGFVRPAGYE